MLSGLQLLAGKNALEFHFHRSVSRMKFQSVISPTRTVVKKKGRYHQGTQLTLLRPVGIFCFYAMIVLSFLAIA